ncbi:MAG: nucleotide exchange factor GrpE [Lentisphaeria bacterium]|nr:nucleotide exchange factor GrpE [Lentisphaeria bacterium]
MSDEEKKEDTISVEDAATQYQSADEAREKGNAQEQPAEEVSEEKTAEPPVPPSLEEQLAEMKGNYLRALADQENYRKRMAREMNDVKESTRIRTLGDVLGVYDLLQMAVEAAKNAQDVAALRQGIEMTFSELKRTFSNLGVSVLDAHGQVFDPAIHQAVGTQPSDEVPEGTVMIQWKPGFKVGDKLLRPAMVVVSSGAAKPAEGEEKPVAEAEK